MHMSWRRLIYRVVHDLPAVGENLQDHLEVYVQHAATQPVSVQPALKKWRRPEIGARWLFLRSGPGATNHFEAGGFVRSNDGVAYPNLMFHFLPLAIRYDGSQPAAKHGYQVHVGPMYSDVRGSLKITSADPRMHPALRFNYLSTSTDRREWVEAIHVARSILEQPAFAAYDGGEVSPGPSVQSTTRSWTGWPGTPRLRSIRPARARSERSSTRGRCGSTGSTASGSSTPRCFRPSPTATSTRR